MNTCSVIDLPTPSDMSPNFPYLYGATPIGVASGQVEAVTSLVTRLGEKRSIRPHVLMASALKQHAKICGTKPRAKRYSYQANGRTVAAQQTVDSLDCARDTNDTAYLTLLPIQELIEKKMHGVLRDHIAYCRTCIEEDKQKYESPYIRLLWLLKPVSSCPTHDLRLYDACIDCGSQLAVIPWIPNPFFCMTCKRDISDQRGDRFQGRPTQLSQWTAKELAKLLGMTNGGGHTLEANSLLNGFQYIVDQRFDGSSADLGFHLKISTMSVLKYCDGRSRPTFPALLRILYQLQLSPVDLFLSKNRELPLADPIQLSRTCNPTARRRQLTTRAKSRIRGELEALLKQEGDIVGPSEFADRFGLPFLTIRYHFYELYSLHRARFDKQEKDKRERSRLARIARVKKAAEKLVKEGVFPSQRKLKGTGQVTATDLTRSDVRKALAPILNKHQSLKYSNRSNK